MERSSYHPPTALINEEGPFSTLPQEHSKDQHHLINDRPANLEPPPQIERP